MYLFSIESIEILCNNNRISVSDNLSEIEENHVYSEKPLHIGEKNEKKKFHIGEKNEKKN